MTCSSLRFAAFTQHKTHITSGLADCVGHYDENNSTKNRSRRIEVEALESGMTR